MKFRGAVLMGLLLPVCGGLVACGSGGGTGPDGATGATADGGPGGGTGGGTSGTGGASAGTGGAVATGGNGGNGGKIDGTGGRASGGAGPGGGGGSATGGGGRASGGAGGRGGGAAGAGGNGGGTATCDPELTRANRTLVAKAINELFVQQDATAIDRYWADPYYQHNPIAKSGVATFKSLIGSLVMSASFSYQHLLTLADCELAVVYGRYAQTGVIFDMFRVREGKIMEHWDSDSGASEATGVDPLDAAELTATTRALFSDFAATVLVGGASARATDFLSTTYSEHHGTPATGAGTLGAWMSSENVTYSKVHHLIVDGNYVFSVSEGKRGNGGFGFYDLFRAEGGKLAEHWDARRSIPASTTSGLPIF